MLTHQTLLGAGCRAKLLVLVGLTIRETEVLLPLQKSLSSGVSSVLQPGWCLEFGRYGRRARWRASTEFPKESRPSYFLSRPRFAVAPLSGVIHTHGFSAVSFTPFRIFHLDSRAPYVSFHLVPVQLSSCLCGLGVSALQWIVRFDISSESSATAKRLARQLPHR